MVVKECVVLLVFSPRLSLDVGLKSGLLFFGPCPTRPNAVPWSLSLNITSRRKGYIHN